MTFKTINETYMHNAIKHLKNGKAAGPDKIPTTIIKDVGDIFTKPLTMIFNWYLTNGVFPDIFRITPSFKSGAKMMSITLGPFQSSRYSQGSWRE